MAKTSKIDVEKVRTSLQEIWSVKYVPKKLSELACSEELGTYLSTCLKSEKFPNHLCLYGKPGTGKNSIVNIIRNTLDVHMLVINASEENGIDDIRGKVLSFCNSGAMFEKPKIIVMNEADGLTHAAQNSMRELMETKANSVRFIFTCNYIDQIIAPLQSRFTIFKVDPPTREVMKRLAVVLKTEKVDFEPEFLKVFIKVKGRDLRRILNDAQALSKVHDKLTVGLIASEEDSNANYDKFFDEIFKIKDLKAIGEKVKSQLFDEDIYSRLAEYCIRNELPAETIPIIADHLWRSHTIFDKDLIFMSCLLTLRPLISQK